MSSTSKALLFSLALAVVLTIALALLVPGAKPLFFGIAFVLFWAGGLVGAQRAFAAKDVESLASRGRK